MSGQRAGRYRHRVEVQRAAETIDDHGEAVLTWKTVARRWAAIEPVSAREFVAAGATQATASHRILLRAGGLDLDSRDRIRFGDRVFGLTAVLDRDERGAVLEIAASEDVDA